MDALGNPDELGQENASVFLPVVRSVKGGEIHAFSKNTIV